MDKKTKEALRRYKKTKARESSDSSSSGSESGSESGSDSYSSSDSDNYRRQRKKKSTRAEKREHCQKKLEAKRDNLKRKLKEAKLKKRAAAAAAVLSGHSHRSSLSPSTQAKLKKLAERQHLREVSKGAERANKHRSMREHKLLLKQTTTTTKSPQHMHQLLTREKIIIQTRTHDRHSEQKLRHDDRRERERVAREKMRRDDEEQQKYGEMNVSSSATDRDAIYASGSRGYSSRERSLDIERTRYSNKRERTYLDADRHLIHERTGELRNERVDNLSTRRRDTSPMGERYAPRVRDVREVYGEEDRER